MDPRTLNAIITAVTNYLYTTLSKKQFLFFSVLFSELSKSMLTMEVLRGICAAERRAEEDAEEKQ